MTDQIQNAAQKQSVQTFPPPEMFPAMYGFTERGPILPPYGSRERDRWLRWYYRHEYNNLIQGAIAGLIKKITSAPYKVAGDVDLKIAIYDDIEDEYPEFQTAVEYFQQLLQMAHFGNGWKDFLSRVLLDYLTQDFGAVVEVIGPGESHEVLDEAATGLAHLDSGRCWTTGNPDYPIIYFSLITNKQHLMHKSRVIRMVDMPDGDERLFGTGMCALSRMIAVAQREILMGRYIEQSLDDKPKPGIMVASGMTDKDRDRWLGAYRREQETDTKPTWGQTLWFYSIGYDQPIRLETLNFSEPPEKFDFQKYVELHVNMIALALGVDKQEVWELASGSIGSGAQSKILAEKSAGKAFADILSNIERMMNIQIFPDGIEFAFEYRDNIADSNQADIDTSYMNIAQTMKGMGMFSDKEIRQLLANKSPTYLKILQNQAGQITATDDDRDDTPEVVADEGATADTSEATEEEDQQLLSQLANALQPAEEDSEEAEDLKKGQKDFLRTHADFVRLLLELVTGRSAINRRRFGIIFRSQLKKMGIQAYRDGLRDGKVYEEPGPDDLFQVDAWAAQQSQFVTKFADELYKANLTDEEIQRRAKLWANMSLNEIYYEGLIAANRNGYYIWMYNPLKEHCDSCKKLNGQVHRLMEWYKRGWLPRTRKLECGGWNCGCELKPSPGPGRGRFA